MRRRAAVTRVAALTGALGAGPALAADAPFWTELPQAARRGRLPSAAELADRARPAVVHVRGTGVERGRGRAPQEVKSVGTGFFIDGSGYVVTNEHVVRGAQSLDVRLYDGREFAACVVGADEATDVALLKVDVDAAVPVLPLGDSEAARVGDPVLAIGSPFGFAHSVSAGIVSASERVIDRSEGRPVRPPREGYAFFLQTDAAINVGNSGGPLVDAYGAAIGINAAFWSAGQAAQGVSFAIPINIAKVLLPRLKAEGGAPRSEVGVDSQALEPGLAAGLGIAARRGALIAGVEPGAPAALAGLQPGDVVLSWDGHPLAGAEDFKIYAQLTRPDREVRISVLHGGRTLERTIVTRAADEGRPPVHPARCNDRGRAPAAPHALEGRTLAPERARGVPGGGGVELVRVDGGARGAGFQPREIVLAVGKVPVRTPDELRRAIQTHQPLGAPVPVLLHRDGVSYWRALPRR